MIDTKAMKCLVLNDQRNRTLCKFPSSFRRLEIGDTGNTKVGIRIYYHDSTDYFDLSYPTGDGVDGEKVRNADLVRIREWFDKENDRFGGNIA